MGIAAAGDKHKEATPAPLPNSATWPPWAAGRGGQQNRIMARAKAVGRLAQAQFFAEKAVMAIRRIGCIVLSHLFSLTIRI